MNPNRPRRWSVPILTLPDGRVFADFGYGFEQVVTQLRRVRDRATLAVPVGSCRPTGGTQPAPAQPTGSEQMLNTRPVNGVSVTNTPAATSCWSNQAGSYRSFVDDFARAHRGAAGGAVRRARIGWRTVTPATRRTAQPRAR